MLGLWRARKKHNRWAVDRLHQAILLQSLRPEFYFEGGARDTFAGRFEMVALHAALVFRRMRSLGPAARDMAQDCFDALFDGFDEALRDIGTGDLSVGKKVRKLGEAFYGRARAYDEAMSPEADAEALAKALVRNVGLSSSAANLFAVYARAADLHLERQTEADLMNGEVAWPRPVQQARSA